MKLSLISEESHVVEVIRAKSVVTILCGTKDMAKRVEDLILTTMKNLGKDDEEEEVKESTQAIGFQTVAEDDNDEED